MSDSQVTTHPLQHSCIGCGKNCENPSTIAEMEASMDLTSLPDHFNKNVQSSDIICPLCIGFIKAKQKTPQQCESPVKKKMRSSLSQESPSSPGRQGQAESPWNTIIVNQIPMDIELERFFSLFSQYGAIDDTYLCEGRAGSEDKHERFARITFRSEEDAWRVWEAFQSKLIKYDDHILMITLGSDDYSPIRDLPTDCLREIFLHLPSVTDKFSIESVCKRWNAVGRESWSNVTKVSSSWPSGAWEKITSRAGDSLRNLRLKLPAEGFEYLEYGSEEAVKILASIAQHCEDLESFAVSLMVIRDELTIKYVCQCSSHLCSIIANNKNLKKLSLRWEYADERFIEAMPPGIEEVYLNSGIGFPACIIPKDLSEYKNLQVLTLVNFCICGAESQGLETVKNLRVLKLNNCRIEEDTFVTILRNNKGLKHLDVNGIDGIGDYTYQHIFELLHLEELLIEDYENSLTNGFDLSEMPPVWRSSLKTLNCSGCAVTDDEIKQFFTPASSISRLYISNCSTTLQCLETAKEWVSQTGASLKIFVDAEMFREWEDSESSKSCTLLGNFWVSKYERAGNHIRLLDNWDDDHPTEYECPVV